MARWLIYVTWLRKPSPHDRCSALKGLSKLKELRNIGNVKGLRPVARPSAYLKNKAELENQSEWPQVVTIDVGESKVRLLSRNKKDTENLWRHTKDIVTCIEFIKKEGLRQVEANWGKKLPAGVQERKRKKGTVYVVKNPKSKSFKTAESIEQALELRQQVVD